MKTHAPRSPWFLILIASLCLPAAVFAQTLYPLKLSQGLAVVGDVDYFQVSPDGSRVIYLADQDTAYVNELYSVPIGGGTAVKLNGPLVPGGDVQSYFQISPDSGRVTYIADQETNDVFDLYAWLAQTCWTTSGGDWYSGINWEGGTLPSASVAAIIATPAVVKVPSRTSPAVADSLFLGGVAGFSVLEFSDGAVLTLPNGAQIQPGAVVRGDGVFATGGLPLDLPNGSELRSAEGDHLTLESGAVTNAGWVEAFGTPYQPAEMEFSGPLTNVATTGAIIGHDSVLRFQQGLVNNGSLSVASGVNDILGDLSNQSGGLITVSGGALAVFYGDVANNSVINVSASGGLGSTAVFFGALTGNGVSGAGRVFIEGDARPGASPGVMEFGGDVSYGPLAVLEIEIGGTEPGAQHDQVTVGGLLTLGGSLEVTLINGFVPAAGMVLDLWDAGAVAGQFLSVSLPTLPAGLFWHTGEVNTTGELRVGLTPETYASFAALYGLTAPDGDEDRDGLCNVFEYLTARNPLVLDSGVALPAIAQVGGEDHVSFVMASPAGSDVTLDVQTSTTLTDGGPGGWTVLASRTGPAPWSGSAPVLLMPAGDGLKLITVTNPISGEPRRFYRLNIRLIP